jgi:hypothetical protein
MEIAMKKATGVAVGGCAIGLMVLAATAQEEYDKLPVFPKRGEEVKSENIGRWFYFVTNENKPDNKGLFTLAGESGECKYTIREDANYVVVSKRITYLYDDKTKLYYIYREDDEGLFWFLPKGNGPVRSAVDVEGALTLYGRARRFHPKS